MSLAKNEFFEKKRYWLLTILVFSMLFIFSSFIGYQNLSSQKYVEKNVSIELCSWKGWYTWFSIIEKENPLWPIGTRLYDQAIYFSAIAPNLTITFHFRISLPELTINYQLKTILLSSIKDVSYWSKEEVICSGELKGGELIKDFQINVVKIETEIKQIKEKLNFYAGDTELRVIAIVRYKGKINVEEINEQKVFLLSIKPYGSYYQVLSTPYEGKVKREVIQKVLIPPSNVEKIISIGPPAIFLFASICIGVMKLKNKPLTKNEIEELKMKKEYKKFKEQISFGEYLEVLEKEKKPIKIKSLRDLVEIAIDMDKRVIYDPVKEIYFIIAEDILYLYQPKRDKNEYNLNIQNLGDD